MNMKEPKLFINEYNSKFWMLNGKFHCFDGPAIEFADGLKEWYVKGKRHRLDGPAIEYVDGIKLWYIDGKQYKTQQEHALAAFHWMNEHERT
jgi:hypothetical protein